MSIDVSIIVPVYNVEKYIDTCVASLTGQTHRNIEILLIDDGSTDDSLPLCRKWERIDPRISVYHKKNEGPGLARNFAIRKARGKYMQFVDSDDWLRPDAVELLFNHAENEGLDAVYFDFVTYIEDTDFYVPSHENSQYLDVPDFVFKKLRNTLLPSSCTVFYNREKWLDMGIEFPACLFEDNAVYPFILLHFERYGIEPKALYYYRVHGCESRATKLENLLSKTESSRNIFRNLRKKAYEADIESLVRTFAKNQLQDGLNILNEKKNYDLYLQCLKKYNEFALEYYGEEIFKNAGLPEQPVKIPLKDIEKKYGRIYVYGAGKIARRVIGAMVSQDCLPDAILVSCMESNPRKMCGLEVMEMPSVLPADTCIVIAVGNKFQQEITERLKEKGIHDYILWSSLDI